MKPVQLPSYLFWTLVLAFISLIFIFFFAMQDGGECLANPLVYGAEKGLTDNSGEIMCSCSFSNPSYAPFYFNDKDISMDRNLQS